MFGVLKNFYLSKSLASSLAKIFVASIIIAFSAHMKLSIGPVPFTMQTIAISVVAYALGSKLAVASLCLYVLEGIVGLPVFASGVGISAIFGTTGGFIVGFIPMAYIMGLAGDKKVVNVFKLSLYSIFAGIVLFAFGLLVLSLYVSSDKLLAVGLYPFILPGLVKAIISAMLISPTCRYFGRF